VDIMVDLETMGTGPDAAIIAIGAVAFDTKGLSNDTFYEVVNLQSSVDLGGVIDSDTVLWWLQQLPEAREEFLKPGIHISRALMRFSEWFEDRSGTNIWGNGAAFDNVILRSAYTRAGIEAPWKFYQDRCFRTIKAMNPLVDTSSWAQGVAHNALSDALWQACYLVKVLSTSGSEKEKTWVCCDGEQSVDDKCPRCGDKY
jgi:hypothetical protein